MKKNVDTQQRYAFRKLKFGLVSVAVALLFGISYQVSADETFVVSDVSTEVTVDATDSSDINNTITDGVITDGPVASAIDSISESAETVIVPEESAEVGDVIDVNIDSTEPVITETTDGDKEIATAQATVTVTTTSIADPEEPVGISDPVVEVSEATATDEDDNYTYTQYEKVTKTTVTEIVKETDVVTNVIAPKADVVFIIDHTGSMSDQIEAVKDNIKDFVSGLDAHNVGVRLGLIDYEDSSDVNYIDFSGSRFTTDTDAFIQALEAITIRGGFEEPTTPLTYIASSGDYDWSTDADAKRFAILITDEDFDYYSAGVPSLESTIQALQAAGISTTVIGETYLQDEFTSLVNATGGIFVDIDSDFAQVLSNDILTWIVETIEEGRLLKVVTETYDFYIEVVAVPKAISSVDEVTLISVKEDDNTPKTTVITITDSEQLPETGSQSNAMLSVAGIISLALASGLVGFKKKTKE